MQFQIITNLHQDKQQFYVPKSQTNCLTVRKCNNNEKPIQSYKHTGFEKSSHTWHMSLKLVNGLPFM
jgi:hypothetical protein